LPSYEENYDILWTSIFINISEFNYTKYKKKFNLLPEIGVIMGCVFSKNNKDNRFSSESKTNMFEHEQENLSKLNEVSEQMENMRKTNELQMKTMQEETKKINEEQLKKMHEELKQNREESEKKYFFLEQKIKQLEDDLNLKTRQIEDLIKEQELLRAKNFQLEGKNQELEEALERRTKELEFIKNEKDAISRENRALKKKVDMLEKKIDLDDLSIHPNNYKNEEWKSTENKNSIWNRNKKNSKQILCFPLKIKTLKKKKLKKKKILISSH